MPALPELQSSFLGALCGDAHGAAMAAIAEDGIPAAERLRIHRNNMRLTLTESLAAVFPAIRGLVGEDFFAAVAGEFIRHSPPSRGSLILYGGGFADFLAAFEPASAVACLPDLARLEWAWHEAFHAADAPVLAAEALAGVAPEAAARLEFLLHPSARFVTSRFPLDAVWSAGRQGEDFAGEIDLDSGGVELLVIRPALDVEVRRLEPGAAVFLHRLADGADLTAAAEAALAVHPAFDLGAALADFLAGATFTDFTTDEERPT